MDSLLSCQEAVCQVTESRKNSVECRRQITLGTRTTMGGSLPTSLHLKMETQRFRTNVSICLTV
jgi:hypothetical protein